MGDYDLLLGLRSSGYGFRYIDLVSIAFAPAGISNDRKITLRESFLVRRRYCSSYVSIYFTLRSYILVYFGDFIIKMFGEKTLRLIQKIKRKYI